MCDVPALRFPEFNGEWITRPIKDIADFIGGGTPSSANEAYWQGTIPWVSSSDIVEDNINDITISRYITEEAISNSATKLCSAPVILIVSRVGVGKVALSSKAICTSQDFCNLINIKVHPTFLAYSLSQIMKRKSIEVQGTSIKGITSLEIQKIILHIPSLQEQHKISDLFQLIDKRIAVQSKIIEDLRLLRDAIMVEHYRKCNKSELCIYDIGEPFNVMNLSKDDLTKDGSPCIIYGELFTTYGCVIENVVSHTTKSLNSTLSIKGDLLFPASTTVDALSLIAPSSINEDGIILGGDMFGIHVNEQYNSNYLSYYFNIIGKKNLAKYAKGSTIIHLHYADIQKAKITLPNNNEQEAVANLLLKVEHKLNIEQKMLINYLNIKNFLLRQMFI